MPTYSYQCTDCGDRFDVVQTFAEDSLTTCSKCSGRLRKLFGSVGVVFKGSGFYRTDSRADGKSSSLAASGSSEKSGVSGNGSSGSGNGSSGSGDKSGGSAEKAGKSGKSDKSTSSTSTSAAAS